MVDNTTCSKCSRKASVQLRSAGSVLCKRHFCDYFEKRFRSTLRKHSMLRRGDSIGVALSGGKDSTVTLHLLAAHAKRIGAALTAISVDEGIRGYRDEALKKARENCEALGVGHVTLSFAKELGTTMDKISRKKHRDALCSYCGVFRRYLLNRACAELRLAKLATGHNLDDVAQTVLMNLMRNEPMRLARFGAVTSGWETARIKPLFDAPEREVALYALLNGLPVHLAECPYAAEAFRTQVRAFVNNVEETHPNTKYNLLAAFMQMKPALEAMLPAGVPNACERCGEYASNSVCKTCEMLAEIGAKANARKRLFGTQKQWLIGCAGRTTSKFLNNEAQ
jgi:uncharacterized protein (TIGR00269 family)